MKISRALASLTLMLAFVSIFSSCKKDPPEADFSYVIDGLTVTFTDKSTGDKLESWSWDFGDGNTSEEQNPEHTYAAGGDYTVTLTVENKKDKSSTSQTITLDQPTADNPTPSIPGVDAALTAIRQTTYTDGGFGGSIATTFGLAVAVFLDGSNNVDVGTVSVDGNDLEQNPNNSYSYTYDASDPTNFGLTFESTVNWKADGGNGFDALDKDHISDWPTVDAISSGKTVDNSSSYTLTVSGATNCDSVMFLILDTEGNSIIATESGSATSHTFSASETGTLSEGSGIAQVAGYNVEIDTLGGKVHAFIKEEVVTESTMTIE